jgi:Protein of unknown function (DUF1194)
MVCAIALVLLMDISASVSADNWILQRNQTAAAVESSEVIDAISQQGAIAISTMLFGSRTHMAMPWRMLRNAGDAHAAANEIRSINRIADISTEIGRAVNDASQNLDSVPCEPDQKIIDLSTDGQSYPPEMESARDAAQLAGIRINVIVVGSEDDAQALRDSVVTHDGFLLHADSWSQYPALFRRKIVLELAGATS